MSIPKLNNKKPLPFSNQFSTDLPADGRGYVFDVDPMNPFSGVQSFALYRSVSL